MIHIVDYYNFYIHHFIQILFDNFLKEENQPNKKQKNKKLTTTEGFLIFYLEYFNTKGKTIMEHDLQNVLLLWRDTVKMGTHKGKYINHDMLTVSYI